MQGKDWEFQPTEERDERDAAVPIVHETAVDDAEKEGEIVVGIDVGTTKVCCVIAEIRPDRIEIIGTGFVASRGIRKGVVVSIEETANFIRQAVAKAEDPAGKDIRKANCPIFVSISGSHIKGFVSPGIILLRDKTITEQDVVKVEDFARETKLPNDHVLIFSEPQEFSVDDNTGIKDPRGMSGVRLSTTMYIVTAARGDLNNLVTCCKNAELSVPYDNVVMESIAAAEAVLKDEEREMGVVLIDIGGGTTGVAVYHNHTLQHIREIAYGGHDLTEMLASEWHTPMSVAEDLKNNFGAADPAIFKDNEYIAIPAQGDDDGGKVPRSVMAVMLEARMRELFEVINEDLMKIGVKSKIKSGIVLTGGGAELEALTPLAETIFGLRVRRGYPTGFAGREAEKINGARFAAAAGLIRHAQKNLGDFGSDWEGEGWWSGITAWFGKKLFGK
ncbi:MAG: cell division protein FtsA [Desulfobulbaceae bacterium]|jgi:cell division protein FtsA|nr:cell division protein FtsA [Desulfobulbaceae bacterium]